MKQARSCFLSTAIIVLLLLILFPVTVAAETCTDWVARVVSVQGSIQALIKDQNQWIPVQMNDTFCTGDIIRVPERSRAAIVLSNETIIRLDQNTTITITGIEKEKTSLLDVINGVAHFISRVPRTLKVSTPFVNGNVEGTEFLVRVYEDHTIFTVFEGKVIAENREGILELFDGQSAIAKAGKAPVSHVVVRPRDAVHWALYYPPVIHYGSEKSWQEAVKISVRHYRDGDLTDAFRAIADVPEESRDHRFYTYRASLLLSVGRVDEAQKDVEQALGMKPDNVDAISIQSVIAVVQNEREKALDLAGKAAEINPDSATAHIALSYARQSNFDLKGALESLQKAVKLEPQNSLAWARLAELQLSFKELDRALDASHKAVSLNPNLSRTQTVLGYAHLSQVKTGEAMKTFKHAIELDQADPLPRLGLGLAKIRAGRLEDGRRDIEIAASLDPNQSLIRSYLGKAYYEEKRDKLSEDQYTMAKELDPRDPTPFFYDAIRKQTINRPVEALQDMQKAIELNDNRAIYRSKLLLDEDLAARSAGLARIYNDLGFEQLALVEGWKSVNTDPGNHSAHRFLADTYSSLPRHEIARVSELLQSQLFQPINITPVQPSLGESNLFILDGAGPGDLSFNEFNPLFNRNRATLQVSGVAGSNDTLGDEVVVSQVHDNFSISTGQFHYETDGFRKNNDLKEDIYNIYAQVDLTHKTSIQGEFRHKDVERGDLPLFFDPDNFIPNFREEEQTDSLRFGIHHTITPGSDVIANLTYRGLDLDTSLLSELDIERDEDGYMAEVLYLYQKEGVTITGGAGYFNSDSNELITSTFIMPPLPPITESEKIDIDVEHTTLYVYSLIHFPETVTWTIGASGDFFNGAVTDEDQFNPKVGITWNPLPDTTLRAALFRTLKKTLIADQTLEPTQVAGFNQFFNDGEGTDAWRYGIGIDQKLSDQAYAGAEFSWRDLSVPGEWFDPIAGAIIAEEFDVDEQLGRAYVYWTPHPWVAFRTEYQYEHFDNPEEFMIDGISELDTHRVIFGINFFHPSGFYAQLRPKYISQDGEFEDFDPDAPFDMDPFDTINDEDDFWIVDASIGYRLPKRYGKISLEAKNLFDKNFRFQDTDPSHPRIYPEQLVLVKFTLAL
jgi:tetratricopeptide (TPR) repeat protein